MSIVNIHIIMIKNKNTLYFNKQNTNIHKLPGLLF